MAIVITPFYAGLLALLFIGLSVRVVRLRRQEKIAIGDRDHKLLQRCRSKFLLSHLMTFCESIKRWVEIRDMRERFICCLTGKQQAEEEVAQRLWA